MIAAPRLPHLGRDRRHETGHLVAAHERLWALRHPEPVGVEDADANRCRRPWHELDVRPLRTRVDARCRVARVGGRADLVGPAELTARPGRGRGPAAPDQKQLSQVAKGCLHVIMTAASRAPELQQPLRRL